MRRRPESARAVLSVLKQKPAAEKSSGVPVPVQPAVGLVILSTAFGGGGCPRRVDVTEFVARAEQLAGEVRAGMTDPTNKVTKSMATFIEKRVSGLMSLLVAATGRIGRLSGECAGLRSAQ